MIRNPARAAWVAAAVLVLSALLLALAWDSVTELGTTVRADRVLVDFFVAHRKPELNGLARAWTLLGSAWIVAPVTAVTVIVLAIRRQFVPAAIIAISTIGTSLSVALVKALVSRPRPPAPDHLVTAVGAAFPSGHSAQSVACYSALAWIVTRQCSSVGVRISVWSVAAIVALGVGWSRVYLGVHWPSDVIGGWSLAAALLAALVLADCLALARRPPAPNAVD